MREILILLIFCLVLFFYLHIYFHIKTSNDLEIYEIEQPSKEKLEEICDLRQPVVFNYQNDRLLTICNRKSILETYGAFDVKIRNVLSIPDEEEEIYIPFSFVNALTAINEDKLQKYFIENNRDFLDETSIIKAYKYNDEFIRPYMVSVCDYDYIIGSLNTQTPFRYNINYRNYYLVTEGNIKIKLAPPKSSKYLYAKNDYEIFEFSSPVNPWNVQKQYQADFDKIKCLEVSLQQGQIIYIPAYWWYSIEFGENSSISVFKYQTYMNTISIIPKLIMKFLQSHNIKRKIVPELKNDNVESINIDNDAVINNIND